MPTAFSKPWEELVRLGVPLSIGDTVVYKFGVFTVATAHTASAADEPGVSAKFTGSVGATFDDASGGSSYTSTGAKVNRSTSQSIAQSPTVVPVSYENEVYDDNNLHFNPANPTQLLAGTVGRKLVCAKITWQAQADANFRKIRLRKNGVTIDYSAGININNAGHEYSQFVMAYDVASSAADIYTVEVEHGNGSATNILAGGALCWFSIENLS
jgi:hypothetical protein